MHPALILTGVFPFALSASVTLRIPPTPHLPNPFVLAPSTHATLSALGVSLSAPLSTANTFVFRNLTPGSYLADVHCATHGFVPLRVDVRPDGVSAWETFRGNGWGNTGEAAKTEGGVVEVRGGWRKDYFMERSKFNVLSILRNPMILLGMVTMGIFFGMPYLVDNMDPEMRAEWEENQKKNPMNSIMGAGQPGASPMGNFDVAAFLAGSSKDDSGKGDKSTRK